MRWFFVEVHSATTFEICNVLNQPLFENLKIDNQNIDAKILDWTFIK